MTPTKKHLTVVADADGQLALDFPLELLERLNWKPGDLLIWTELPDGDGFLVSKADKLVSGGAVTDSYIDSETVKL